MRNTCILFIYIFLSCFLSSEANDFFVYLVQDKSGNRTYQLHYAAPQDHRMIWTNIPINSDMTNLEDVEYNYKTKVFYFSSSRPGSKGIWKGTQSLDNFYKSHQLREETTPLTLRVYPAFDVVFVYDAGYESVLAISLRNEKDLRIKSLFVPAEGLDGTFFLDLKKNRLIAENRTYTILTSNLYNASSVRSEFTLSSPYTKNTKLLAYDMEKAMLHYCVNGSLLGMSMDGHDPIPARGVPCAPIAANLGAVFYTNTTSQFVTKIAYNITAVSILNDHFLPLPFDPTKFDIISFKYYDVPENTNASEACDMDCSHICVPQDDKGTSTCACTDYYVAEKDGDNITCVKDTLHSPGIIYAISTSLNNTLFYRLEGSPAAWIRRPQREQLFTIRSGIIGLAIDWDIQRLLIAETQFRQIASAKMDGSFNTSAHYAGLSVGVKSIAFDWVGENIIWFDPVFKWLRIVPLTDYQSLSLHRSDHGLSSIFSLTTSNIFKTSLASSELDGYSLSLDANAGFLFFLDLDDPTGLVYTYRTLMDATNLTRIFKFPSDVFDYDAEMYTDEPLPGSLIVDFNKKNIWVAFTESLFVFDYNGVSLFNATLSAGGFTRSNSRVSGIQVFQSNFMFVAFTNITDEASTMFVYEIVPKADGTCCDSIVLRHNRTFFGEFRAMTAYQATPPITKELNCSLLRCQFMCSNINGRAACMCPDGYLWNATKSECTSDPAAPASPVVVYNNQEKICYRSLDSVDQPATSISSSFFDADYCFSNGKKVYSVIEPDHQNYRIYAVQQNHMPAAIYNLRLRSATRVFEWISLPLGILTQSATDEADVFYSGNTVVALAFDWLGRNLYIADQSSSSLVVLRDNYYFPALLEENVNITGLVVDAMRRKLYRSTFSNVTNESTISQINLDASGECKLATVTGSVVQMQISYSNNTLLFLEQPSNRIGKFVLRELPPFADCSQPTIVYTNLAKPNVSQFALYQRVMLFSTGSSSDLKVYVSYSMGANVDSTMSLRKPFPLSPSNPSLTQRNGPIKSLSVINPYLLWNETDHKTNLLTNPSDLSRHDSCAGLDHGRCEHLCLAAWDGLTSKSHCACTDGMKLLADKRHCAPRPIDLQNDGGIISVDDYHHKVFMLPLKTLTSGSLSFNVQQNLSALFIHAKARPYSVAIDAITSEIYFGDHERGSIVRVNPYAQMTRTPNQGHMEETVLHLGNKVYGLFIDPNSRLLFYTHREGHYLAAWDMEQKISARIYMAGKYTSIYGVVMDRRVDKMHVYVATRNVSTPTMAGMTGSTASTWSAIVRCYADGSQCMTCVNFTATGKTDTKTVPWIYELSIDYQADRLYFTTGQNRSIMYLDLKNVSAPPSIFAVEGGDKEPSFIYGLQVYKNYLLASDWQHRGIHVFDLKTGTKKGVIGGSFFTGLNGLAIYSREHEDNAGFSQACMHSDTQFCSHICVPMPNNKRACKCPEGDDPTDGVNCKNVVTCGRPDTIYGSFDANCTLRPGATCGFTCSTGSQIRPELAGKFYSLNCVKVNGTATWNQAVESLCMLAPSTSTASTTTTTTTTAKAAVIYPKSTTAQTKSTSEGTSPKSTQTTFYVTPRPGFGRGTSGEGKAEAASRTRIGIIISIVVLAIVLVALVISLLIYFKRRPIARGFRRLDDAPGGGGGGGAGNLITGSAAAASGVPAGTVAFRNPMFGMEDIDNVTVIDPRTQQPTQQSQQQTPGGQQNNNKNNSTTGSQAPREGQVVIF